MQVPYLSFFVFVSFVFEVYVCSGRLLVVSISTPGSRQGHFVFCLKHAWQVELDVLVDKEGDAGRWQNPDDVRSESVVVRVLAISDFDQMTKPTLCRIRRSPRISILA